MPSCIVKCDQIQKSLSYIIHTFVPLKSDLDVEQTHLGHIKDDLKKVLSH